MPAALTATRISPAAGIGAGTSACCSLLPIAKIRIAFIFAALIVTLTAIGIHMIDRCRRMPEQLKQRRLIGKGW